MKKILLVGGGSGLADIFPAFLRVKDFDTRAVVSTFDSGGSSGVLRNLFQIPALGDIRKVASATKPRAAAALLEARLPSGHAVGNLELLVLVQELGFKKAVQRFAGDRVLPISFDVADLVLHFQKKKKLVGEHHLDVPPPAYEKEMVQHLSLTKNVALNPAVKKALREADVIVVGPGSLLGSLLPHFLIPDFVTAFEQSRAVKILVAPRSREWGARGESAEEMAERFPVSFDEIVTRELGRWTGAELLREIQKLLQEVQKYL